MENQTVSTQTNNNTSDEISLLDLFAVLVMYKKMIAITIILGMFFAVAISILSLKLPPEKSFLPNTYTASGNMLINDSKSSGGSLASAIASSGLGGLAGLAGISSSGGATYSSLAIYLISSNPFLDAVVREFDLLSKPAFEKSKYPITDSRKMVKKAFSANLDSDSGVFSISYKDIDPVFAQKVVNYAIDWLSEEFDQLGVDKNKITKINLEKNIRLSFEEISRLQKEANSISNSVSNDSSEWTGNIPSIALTTLKNQMELTAQEEVYKQLKTQYELLKVEMQSEAPVFQILERPEIAEMKSGPSRGKLCIIITFASGFFAVFLAFLRNALHNLKKDPEAMAKLRKSRKD